MTNILVQPVTASREGAGAPPAREGAGAPPAREGAGAPPAREGAGAPKKKHYVVLTKEESFRLGQPGWSSRGYIPHYSADGRTQHITFRLVDALPREVIEKWQAELRILPEGEAQRQKYILVERYLDAGHGACYLRNPQCADIVQQTLLYLAGAQYDLHAWCVMPNHVHTLLTPYPGWEWSAIVGAWRSVSARKCNLVLGRTGRFWQRDPFDRYMRDQAHFDKTVRYIENNPVKAGLCKAPEDWLWNSASWRKKLESE
jgi:REP element-mobilizing transposase RayT